MRDIYGNWVWQDTDEEEDASKVNDSSTPKDGQGKNDRKGAGETPKEESLKLEWRDYVALTLASLQTVLLPIIVMIVILIVVALLFFH